MRKRLAIAAGAAAVVLSASPAYAASQAGGTARIYRPLTLSSDQNLDFGTIVLSGASFTGESVVMPAVQTPTLTCGTTSGDLTCSGTPTPAHYTVKGANNTTVVVTDPAFNLSNGTTNLTFTPNGPGTVSLGATGNSTGTSWYVGGTLSGLSNATPDGVYTGTFAMTVSYQ